MHTLLSREARFVLLAAGGPANDAELRVLASGGLDWEVLCAVARHHAATAVVWRRAQQLECGVPRRVADEMHRATVISEFTLLRARDRLAETIAAFGDAGIRVTLLKGAAVAATAYESFAHRPMRDFDVLVDSARIDEAHAIACGSGWARSEGAAAESAYVGHHHIAPLVDRRGTGMHLELHRSLFMSGHPFELPPALLQQRSRPVNLNGQLVGVPVRSILLLHACLHFAWSHGLRSGAWRTMRDVARLTDTRIPVWDELVRLATATRGRTCCYWTLRLARDLAGVQVPDHVMTSLEPPVPELIRSRIVRHFAFHAMSPGVACPSAALDMRMWSLAVRPGWSGHGRSRPWDRTEAFMEAGSVRSADEVKRSVLVRHMTRLPAWKRYLGAVLRPAALPTPIA